ncbi:hypothetical protein CVV68_09410 [Arthrobacter livingstonensis]|uniref:Uncharacterized protein n=1 Tax=Arthrobacter livingstonensis TaxID=670078 RepID=A0A2V5L806_9MICC|nr:hypothetical protein CVV68_09410 [Arthrobacter livingstonensis]
MRLLCLVKGERLDAVLQLVAAGEVEELSKVLEASPDARGQYRLTRDRADAEGDSSTPKSDDDDDPLPVYGCRGSGEGGVGAHEVDDGVVLTVQFVAVACHVRPEFCGHGEFFGAGIHDRQLDVGQGLEKLYGKLTQPAGADDYCPGAGP